MESMRILTVDDEHLILRIIKDILSDEGYEVETAPDCKSAIQTLKKKDFDAVLTDIRMPDKDGVQVLKEIRSFNPNIPVIFMTGFASLESAMEAVKNGAFDYITKPLDYNKLKSIIKHAVEKYQLVKENNSLIAQLKEVNNNLELKVKDRNRDLENILNSTHESILTAGKDFVVKTANSKSVEHFSEECIGKSLSDIFCDIGFDSFYAHLLSDTEYSKNFEVKVAEKFLNVRLSPLIDFESKEIFGVIAVSVDVTEKKNLEMQLIQSAKMSAVGQLAAGVSHEFNNVLSAIIGYTSFAMSRSNIDKIKEDLAVIQKASNRAVDIVNNLLSFSKQENDNQRVLPVEDVIEDAVSLLGHSLESEGIKIIRHYGKIPPVKINVGEIQQVILNMAINAQHAMPKGGVIAIKTELDGDNIKIHIIDNGIGIDSDKISRIFEPFYTTKNRGDKSGTGLGLSVAYAIIDRHKGSINVESEINKGTTFTISLPHVKGQKINEETKIDDKQTIPNVASSGGIGSILVVDDEDFITDVIRECLIQLGHNVLVANDGETAIELVKRNHFDIIFLDLSMPGKSGIEVLKELKVIDPNSVVVVVSARSDGSTVERVKSDGAFTLISKPFTVNEIQDTVSKVLQDDVAIK